MTTATLHRCGFCGRQWWHHEFSECKHCGAMMCLSCREIGEDNLEVCPVCADSDYPEKKEATE